MYALIGVNAAEFLVDEWKVTRVDPSGGTGLETDDALIQPRGEEVR
jgi:hypothetical protein